MEVMEVSGYVSEEKVAIASKYLAPQAKDGAGLKNADVQITADAIDTLIRYYARESGVRRLKQHIEKVSPSRITPKWRISHRPLCSDLPKGGTEDR